MKLDISYDRDSKIWVDNTDSPGIDIWNMEVRETIEEMAARHARETAEALGFNVGGGEPAKPAIKPSDYLEEE